MCIRDRGGDAPLGGEDADHGGEDEQEDRGADDQRRLVVLAEGTDGEVPGSYTPLTPPDERSSVGLGGRRIIKKKKRCTARRDELGRRQQDKKTTDTED